MEKQFKTKRMGLQRLFGLFRFNPVNRVVAYAAYGCLGQLLLSFKAIPVTALR